MSKVQYPWSRFWIANTFPNGTFVSSQSFEVLYNGSNCITSPTRAPTPMPYTPLVTQTPTPGTRSGAHACDR